MGFEFIPLDILIYLKKIYRLDESNAQLVTANIKVLVYDLIEIIKGKNIEQIQGECGNYVFNPSKQIPDFDIRQKIFEIIPELMQLCDSANMMKCFTNRLKNV